METAGSAIVQAIQQHYPRCQRIGIFAGKGNNGGDGIVITRQLVHAGRDVHLFLVSPPDSFTGEAAINLQIAKNLGLPIEAILTDAEFKSNANIANCELLVDAILGTGLRGTVRAPIATIIKTINNLSIPILSVDLPSGLDADTGHPLGTCVRADRTITIGLPKRGLLVQSGCRICWNIGSR